MAAPRPMSPRSLSPKSPADGGAHLQGRNADLQSGAVDASIMTLAERLGESKVATLDQQHFRAVRSAHVGTLELRP
jgi:hypothetical protein